MLSLIYLLSLRFDQCVSPLLTPPPIEGARLLHAQLIFRHGARTPGDNFTDTSESGPWHCDHPDAISPRYYAAPLIHPRNYHEKFDHKLMPYPPSCRNQDLLTIGMQQLHDLGETFRTYLVDLNGLLSSNFSPWEVLARSTNVDRAIRSTISFIQGMYPPASPNEVVQLMTDTDSAELLDASDSFCAELANQKSDFETSEKFLAYFKLFSDKYQKVLEPLIGSWKPSKVKKFASYVLMVNCTDHTLPNNEIFTDQLLEDCVEFMGTYHFGIHDNDKYRGIACATLYREMLRMADEFLSMKTPQKLVLIGSHDTELSALLAAVGYTAKVPPQVRSHFLFELWEVTKDDDNKENIGKILARISFNGKVLPISFLGNKTTYTYAQFKGEMSRIGYLDHCFVPEWKKY